MQRVLRNYEGQNKVLLYTKYTKFLRYSKILPILFFPFNSSNHLTIWRNVKIIFCSNTLSEPSNVWEPKIERKHRMTTFHEFFSSNLSNLSTPTSRTNQFNKLTQFRIDQNPYTILFNTFLIWKKIKNSKSIAPVLLSESRSNTCSSETRGGGRETRCGIRYDFTYRTGVCRGPEEREQFISGENESRWCGGGYLDSVFNEPARFSPFPHLSRGESLWCSRRRRPLPLMYWIYILGGFCAWNEEIMIDHQISKLS